MLRSAHAFADAELLRQALTHRSFGAPHNERLEFVGDAVLNCVVARALYERFPDTARRRPVARARAISSTGTRSRGSRAASALGSEIRLGEGELQSGGADRASILADALEAVFGAVFLDGGFDGRARRRSTPCTPTCCATPIPRRSARIRRRGCRNGCRRGGCRCRSTRSSRRRGEAHAQQFAVECRIPALGIVAAGRGASRRAAEQDARRRRARDAAIAAGPHGGHGRSRIAAGTSRSSAGRRSASRRC